MNICLCCGRKQHCGCQWRVTAEQLNGYMSHYLRELREQCMNYNPDREDKVHDCTTQSSCMNIVRAIDVILERRLKDSFGS